VLISRVQNETSCQEAKGGDAIGDQVSPLNFTACQNSRESFGTVCGFVVDNETLESLRYVSCRFKDEPHYDIMGSFKCILSSHEVQLL
jgi:hypothetical protein